MLWYEEQMWIYECYRLGGKGGGYSPHRKTLFSLDQIKALKLLKLKVL